MVLHQIVDKITSEHNLTPDEEFRVTASIKRLIHSEKYDVYTRCALYAEIPGRPGWWARVKLAFKVLFLWRRIPKDPFIMNHLREKRDTHRRMLDLPDEEIVTWSVGSHTFKQG